jgi:hypothetical protein
VYQESCPHGKYSARKANPNIPIHHAGGHVQRLLIYALCYVVLTLLMTLGSSAQEKAVGGETGGAGVTEPGQSQTETEATKNKVAEAAKDKVAEAAKQGFRLKTTSNVKGNVSIAAVLIPPKITGKVFGKTIGNTYAAIALTISNRSPDAALIVHTILIDYSRWLLGGYSAPAAGDSCTPTANDSGEPIAAAGSLSGNSVPDWETKTCPNQIASVEYRIVRGQLQEEQPYTWRNWVIRSLELTGSVATAASFSIGSRHAIQAINGFTGAGIPAMRLFLPDDTVGQMDRISDLAFRVNKVIPKESADIIVAFFPIDRFLTPGFKKWFIESPALFFAPYAMVLDPKSPKEFKNLIEMFVPDPNAKNPTQETPKENPKQNNSTQKAPPTQGTANVSPDQGNSTEKPSSTQGTANVSPDQGNSTKKHRKEKVLPKAKEQVLRDYVKYVASGACGTSDKKRENIEKFFGLDDNESQKACLFSQVLSNASLNTVHVVVGGTMTVNVDNVPAKIDSIECTTPDQKPITSWEKAQDVVCVVHGSFLGNGQPSVVNGDQLGITNLAAVADISTEKDLHFKMSLTKLLTENKLTFKVVKKTAAGANVESGTYDYQITTQAPQISSVECLTGDNKPLVRAASAPGEVSCVVKGSSLTGGTAKVVNADALGNPTLTIDKNASNDSELHFKMTISKALTDNIQFQVTKTTNDGKTLPSNELVYPTAPVKAPEPAKGTGKTGAAKAPKRNTGLGERTGNAAPMRDAVSPLG